MAPELAARAAAVDAKSDVFSFGVLAYELLSGTAPFPEPPVVCAAEGRAVSLPQPLAARAPAVAPELAALILECLQVEPSFRPTARVVAERLARLTGTVR
jgi:serine/threonine-protein kinase